MEPRPKRAEWGTRAVARAAARSRIFRSDGIGNCAGSLFQRVLGEAAAGASAKDAPVGKPRLRELRDSNRMSAVRPKAGSRPSARRERRRKKRRPLYQAEQRPKFKCGYGE